ncbi:MAG: histone deacetylase [Candidatus Kapabacteria bacterium]|nr:histone deacetylase [Candidatus Kapabacteria bacterium]
MRVFYSDHYTIDLPDGHRFPMRKYRMLRHTLTELGIIDETQLFAPELASRDDVLLAHTQRYVDGVISGTLDRLEQRRIGFPWSPGLVDRSLATVGGCLASARAALKDGLSGNLAGGTHHALRDAGEGFCVFNDIAIATLRLMHDGRVRRVAIVDLDVHQGNGNSDILGGRDDVYILSVHGAKNYPFRKVPSTVDVDLPDGTSDAAFLAVVERELDPIVSFCPDIVFYQCGVDPLESDALGRLSLTFEGLARRDRLVLETFRRRGIPVMLALGGGYAQPIEDTIKAQCNLYRIAMDVFHRFPGVSRSSQLTRLPPTTGSITYPR